MSDVNFTPNRGAYTELTPFRYWCQKVLPLVYDDSISYYELLCKVVNYLNITMEDVSTLNDDVTAMYTAYDELQDFVNQYFTDLNVQRQIDNKLDRMAADGSLNALIDPVVTQVAVNTVGEALPDIVEEQLPDVVEDQIDNVVAQQIGTEVAAQITEPVESWLSANISASDTVLDSTLSLYNAAARSKSAGILADNYAAYLGAEERYTNYEAYYWTVNNGVATKSSELSPTYNSIVISVTAGTKYTLKTTGILPTADATLPRYIFADASNNVIEVSTDDDKGAIAKTITAPAGATKLIVNDKTFIGGGDILDTYLTTLLVKGELAGSGEIADLKAGLSYTTDILITGYKKIPNAYIESNGTISAVASYDLHCFQVSAGAVIDSISDSGAIVYAFFTDKPQLGSVSYNNSRIVRTYNTEENINIPSTTNWIAVRCPSGGTVEISPKSKTLSDITGSVTQEVSARQAADSAIYEEIDKINQLIAKEGQISYAMNAYTFTIGEVPTPNSAVSRFRTNGYFLLKKGETISTKISTLMMLLVLCDESGVYQGEFVNWTNTYTAPNNVYCYVNFKDDNVSNFTGLVDYYAYNVHIFNIKDSHWAGKSWYCFGTSMSDINPDGVSGNNGTMGKYPLVVDELSGLIRNNQAIGSGGICPGAAHGGNVKTNIMNCPYDVDLVTLECGLNDWGSVTLGTIGDTSNDTFIGNFTQCIQHLTYNTRAKVVLITMVGTTYTDATQTTRRSPFFKNSFGYYYRDYLDAEIKICQMYGVEVIDAEANAMSNGRLNKATVIDSIHLKPLGGEILGRYVWSKLKDILPMPNIPQSLT